MINRDKFTLLLLTLSALSISGAAAFFSVYGLSKVFAGAGISVIIMASILEISKIITAYALHQNVKKLPAALKSYLIIAVIVLMLITSAGIYGYLSNAYQLTANRNTIVERQINIVQAKVNNQKERLDDLLKEKQGLVSDMNNLRQGFTSGTSIESVDRRTGQRVISRDASITRSLNAQLDDATARRNKIDTEIDILSASIDSLKISILEKQSNNDAAAELGPIIYLSKITKIDMDILMNYFILLIVFVFDPLAISLVLALSHIREYNESIVSTIETVPPITPAPENLGDNNEQPIPLKNTENDVDDAIEKIPDQTVSPIFAEENFRDDVEEIENVETPLQESEEQSLYNPASSNTSEIQSEPVVPKLKVKTVRKEIPGYKIVDNGQKVPDFKEIEEVIIEPEDGSVSMPLSPEEYARLLDKYIAQIEQLKNNSN